jgi:hypothetical protein
LSETNSDFVGLAIIISAQAGMLAMRYGFKIVMPWWVTWFPSLFFAAIFGIILCFIALIFVALIFWFLWLGLLALYNFLRYRNERRRV